MGQGRELRLPDLVWGYGLVGLFLVSSLVISRRLGASDPFILLQSLKDKKQGPPKLKS